MVDGPADALLLVTAGAGAGKTTTLVERIGRLVVEEDVAPYEILVLSFSRAAVRTLSNQLKAFGEDAGLVRARTFDSWAFELLAEVDGAERWASATFDARVRAATRALDEGRLDDHLADLRHVVVDEAQDLVGIRRELVGTLLKTFRCGFTVVGDVAQSIYGFQVEDPARRRDETNAFLRDLREHFGSELTEIGLTKNFRARTNDARRALHFGPRLRAAAESAADRDGRYEALRTELMEVLPLGDLSDEFVRESLQGFEGTTAILCRTNGEALLVSGRLAEGGVPHGLRRGAEDRVAPAWLAALFRAGRGNTLTRATFDDLVLGAGAEGVGLWGLLLRCAGGSGHRTVDLARLRRAIAEGRLPDEIAAEPPAGLLVSSFHRAKGLEFDRVVVVDPGPLREWPDADEAEEARLLYVAMTRARDEIWRLEPQRSRWVHRDDRSHRWARFGVKQYQRLGMELAGRDTSSELPPGAPDSAAVLDAQSRLVGDVMPGDPVHLERIDDVLTPPGTTPEYAVVHETGRIGTASPEFRTALYRLLQRHPGATPRSFPRLIRNVRVEGVQTVVGSEAAGSEAGLNEHGVWRTPRLVGLGRFTYDKKGEDA